MYVIFKKCQTNHLNGKKYNKVQQYFIITVYTKHQEYAL